MLAVIVVTYSVPAETLQATLVSIESSLAESTGPSQGAVPVIVVDTGGHARLPEAALDLASHWTRLELHRIDNRGYGAAANVGFARAREVGAKRLLLLNDDVIVQPGCVQALLAELDDHAPDSLQDGRRIGAVQPKLVFAHSGRINSLGVALDAAGAGSDIGSDTADHDLQTQDIKIFTGGAVMFTAEFIESTGGFDERFMLYYEDVDLALRGTELGWRYRLVPTAVVEHFGGLSTSAQPDRTRFLQERNRLWNAARHGDPATTTRALWLSVRRLRHQPYGVHVRALAAGVAGMPSRLMERRLVERRLLKRRLGTAAPGRIADGQAVDG